MKLLTNVLIGFLLLVFNSCLKVNEGDDSDLYFNLGRVIEQNVDSLFAYHSRIDKIAEMDGKVDTTSYVPDDSIKWKQELSLFKDADISAPANKGLFSIEDSTDSNSNLKVRTFRHDGDESHISMFRVYYFDQLKNVVKIEIDYKNESSGIFLDRKMELYFKSKNSFQVISGWKIQGFQKVLGMDPLDYRVEATVH